MALNRKTSQPHNTLIGFFRYYSTSYRCLHSAVRTIIIFNQ
jgi:hypothetical protein